MQWGKLQTHLQGQLAVIFLFEIIYEPSNILLPITVLHVRGPPPKLRPNPAHRPGLGGVRLLSQEPGGTRARYKMFRPTYTELALHPEADRRWEFLGDKNRPHPFKV